jgi:hypothetical protein
MAVVTGLITVNGKEILEVDADPGAGPGTPAPIASLALYDDGSAGSLYIKSGAADTAWSIIQSPDIDDWNLTGNTLTGTEFLGSLNDQDVNFRRNNLEVMRLVGSTSAVSGLLIGLSSSIGGRLQLAPNAAGDDIMKQVLSPTSNPVIQVSRMHRLTTSGATSQTFSLAIPNDYNAQVKSRVVARQTAGTVGAVGDGASYERTCHARNISGTVTRLGLQTDYTYEVVGSLNFTLAANGANIEGTVTGAANRDISWGIYSELLLITT